ncbi:MAG: hypothetical protein ACT4PJ_07365 [Gemmatimonadaceae bacterium]
MRLLPEDVSSDGALAFARRVMIAILLLGMLGILVELLLLEHFEDTLQVIPLGLLGLGAIVLVWQVRSPGRAALRTLRVLMVLYLVSGALGVFLHYRGNVEFELERRPQAGRWELFREAMMGATPALAPWAMIQLGLLGLLYSALVRRDARVGTGEVG